MKRIITGLPIFLFLVAGCGKNLTENLSPELVPLQRSTRIDPTVIPSSQGVPEKLSRDWNVQSSIAGSSNVNQWTKEMKDAGEKINSGNSSKLEPDHSYRSIWVHIFPVFSAKKGTLLWPQSMGAPDPYAPTKDFGSIKFDSSTGFKVARLSDGTLIQGGKSLSFNLAKNEFILDGNTFPLENLYLDARSTDVTEVKWDNNRNPYRYRGGFVITREACPSRASCLRVVNVLDFEAYLSDVVPGEMPADYPEEALKVQAVAARTYALNRMLASRCEFSGKSRSCRKSQANPFDVFPNTQDQLYLGVAKENSRTNLAVAATAGEVVIYEGEVALAMFHANSGGRTCSFLDFYGDRNIPYLLSRAEPDLEQIRRAPGGFNTTSINPKSLASAVRAHGIKFDDLEVVSFQPSVRNSSGRTEEVVVRGLKNSVKIPEEIFSKIRSQFRIPTTYIEGSHLTPAHDKIVVTSYGMGHGIGISQEGARIQALRRLGYKDIIGFYYQKCNVLNLKKVIPGSF